MITRTDPVILYMTTSDDTEKGHSIADFIDYIFSLPAGQYIYKWTIYKTIMKLLKYILKLFVLVLCVFLQVHGTLYTRFSFNPVTIMGIMYYDDLYKVFPVYTFYIAIFAFQSLVTFLLIYIIFKRIYLLCSIISFVTCIPIIILGYYIIDTYCKSMIFKFIDVSWVDLYYSIYGWNFFYYIMASLAMQLLLLYYYGICQLCFLTGKKQIGTKWLYIEDKTNLKTKLNYIIKMIKGIFTILLTVATINSYAQNTAGSYALRADDELTKQMAEYMPDEETSQGTFRDMRPYNGTWYLNGKKRGETVNGVSSPDYLFM